MEKYYIYFWHKGKEFVLKFRVKNGIFYDNKQCSWLDMHNKYHSTIEILSILLDEDIKDCDARAFVISHEDFKYYRSIGVTRWPVNIDTIYWD